MSDKGIGTHLYEYFYGRYLVRRPGGKIEEFIEGKENVDDRRLSHPTVYPEVATEMARMHLSTYEELPLAVKLDDCTWWNWNTNCIYEHLTTQWEGGGIRLVARALEIPLEEMDDEYKWIDAKGIMRNNTQTV